MQILKCKINTIRISTLVELNRGQNPYTKHPISTQRRYLVETLIRNGVITEGRIQIGNQYYDTLNF